MTAFRPFLYLALCSLFPLVGEKIAMAQPPSGWLAHDIERPRPPVVKPSPQSLPIKPPADAVVLFNGKGLEAWRSEEGDAPRWRIEDDYMESVPESGYLVSAQGFGDVQLHVEWAAPTPPSGEGQGRGNSGVFLMGKYEVQILDSFGNDTYPDGQAAAIYGQYPPLVNACLPPGEWQSYDIVFRRPRFDEEGGLLASARITVLHNGVLVHDARELWGPTSWLQHSPYDAHADRLPLALQDHGNPVRFRNIWLRELPETEPPGPTRSIARPYYHLSEESLARFAGDYANGDADPMTIVIDDGKLWWQPKDRPRLELVAHSANEFWLRWTACHLKFHSDAEGRVTELEMALGGRDYHIHRRQDEPSE